MTCSICICSRAFSSRDEQQYVATESCISVVPHMWLRRVSLIERAAKCIRYCAAAHSSSVAACGLISSYTGSSTGETAYLCRDQDAQTHVAASRLVLGERQ